MLLRGDTGQESLEHDRKQLTASGKFEGVGGYNVSYIENVKGMKLKVEKEKSMNTTLYEHSFQACYCG